MIAFAEKMEPWILEEELQKLQPIAECVRSWQSGENPYVQHHLYRAQVRFIWKLHKDPEATVTLHLHMVDIDGETKLPVAGCGRRRVQCIVCLAGGSSPVTHIRPNTLKWLLESVLKDGQAPFTGQKLMSQMFSPDSLRLISCSFQTRSHCSFLAHSALFQDTVVLKCTKELHTSATPSSRR